MSVGREQHVPRVFGDRVLRAQPLARARVRQHEMGPDEATPMHEVERGFRRKRMAAAVLVKLEDPGDAWANVGRLDFFRSDRHIAGCRASCQREVR